MRLLEYRLRFCGVMLAALCIVATNWLSGGSTPISPAAQEKAGGEGILKQVLGGEEPKKDSSPFKNLKYRLIGPYAGGRVSRSAGIPGDPSTYYVGASMGGVWKTTDGGITFKPIFDDQPISSIGSLAVAASDPNVIYVGSGEANIRGNVAAGNGIYKSSDGGKSWKHVWKQECQIGHMIVHPKNADIAFAAVLGHAFGPNEERGVYRTTDGGKTWKQVLTKVVETYTWWRFSPDRGITTLAEKVLDKTEHVGAIDVCFDPNNPRILFAALWQARRSPWSLTSGGPGSGLYRSDDGGDTWKLLGPKAGDANAKDSGLPAGPYGRIGVAVAPSDSRRVYALIEAEKGGLYRSDNGGEKWERINPNRYLQIRPWYFSTVHVDPRNADVVYCPNLRLLKSIDAGKTFKQLKGPHHVDHHDLWIDPKNPKRMIDSNDGGVDITTNGGETWHAPLLPIAQFYHINVDNRVPYHVSGTMQDMGTASGPSNSLTSAGIQISDWYQVGGGETGFTMPDPTDPNIVYAGEYGGYISRFDFRTRQAHNISIYPITVSGFGAEELAYRFQWTAPILISPHDPKTVYHGANVLFKTTNAGKTWQKISPDLTRDDKSKQKFSGGPITGDNTGAEIYCTIFAIAESPKEKGVLWAGTDDGFVHISRDGGKSWQNITKNISGLPTWATVRCIETSRFDAATAYIVADNHRLDDTRPYLWKTSDYGKTWKSLTAKLPPDVYLHVVREDPKKQGMLYLGTERGVRYSSDDGASWLPLKLNLPTVAVSDLIVKDNDLVVGTNGRSIWILDDLTPLRHFTTAEKNWPDVAWIKDVSPTYRWRYHSPVYSTEDRLPGENPPKGALIHYYLKSKVKEVKLEIRDERGNLVQSLSSKKPETDEVAEDDPDAPSERFKPTVLPIEPGLHRIVWDLRHKGAELIKGAKVDLGNPRVGPLVNPGKYTLRLTVDEKVFPDATLTVSPDPRVNMPAADLDAQRKLALQVRDDISRLATIVNHLRGIKRQLTSRNELLKDHDKAAPLIKQSTEVIGKLDSLEEKLHNPKAEVVYDILAQRGGAKLYSQLSTLFEALKDSDGAPTQGVREVYAVQARELRELETEWQRLLANDLRALNERARKLELPTVVLPGMDAGGK